jgi:hypothetical protein
LIGEDLDGEGSSDNGVVGSGELSGKDKNEDEDDEGWTDAIAAGDSAD